MEQSMRNFLAILGVVVALFGAATVVTVTTSAYADCGSSGCN